MKGFVLSYGPLDPNDMECHTGYNTEEELVADVKELLGYLDARDTEEDEVKYVMIDEEKRTAFIKSIVCEIKITSKEGPILTIV